jgi:hypothetical protein
VLCIVADPARGQGKFERLQRVLFAATERSEIGRQTREHGAEITGVVERLTVLATGRLSRERENSQCKPRAGLACSVRLCVLVVNAMTTLQALLRA